jgi:predicted  nucleic acid-binding Zn-ribbon protein
MSDDDTDTDGLRERLTKQGEDTLGKMAEDLLANPIVSGAIARAFEAREKATAVQEATLAALNIPSAADIERLTRRVRSVSQRLEGIEDGIDRVEDRIVALSEHAGIEPRLDSIEGQLAALMRELVALRAELPGATEPVPSRQERLKVSS